MERIQSRTHFWSTGLMKLNLQSRCWPSLPVCLRLPPPLQNSKSIAWYLASDADQQASNPGDESNTLFWKNGKFCIAPPENVCWMWKGIFPWLRKLAEELRGSSVQHPDDPAMRWLVHSRRIPKQAASMPEDQRPMCAGASGRERAQQFAELQITFGGIYVVAVWSLCWCNWNLCLGEFSPGSSEQRSGFLKNQERQDSLVSSRKYPSCGKQEAWKSIEWHRIKSLQVPCLIWQRNKGYQLSAQEPTGCKPRKINVSAVLARRTFPSQMVKKNTTCSEQFWDVQMSKKVHTVVARSTFASKSGKSWTKLT